MLASVSRTMAILQFLASQEAGSSLTDIVQATGIEKSMVSRILGTLQHDKYVVRTSSNEHIVGLKFVSMAIQQLELSGLLSLCQPILQKIADESGELVQLAMADGDNLYFVAKADGKARIRIQPKLGTRAPLHATAVGKIYLASLPEEDALKLALNAGLERFTENTITTVDRLRTELARVRRAGYALNHEENFSGSKGIAVPVFGRDGSIVSGAIVIVAPTFRMSNERAKSFLSLLKKQAESLRGIQCLARSQDFVAREGNLQMVG